MKYFFPLLIAGVVLVGLMVNLTPLIAGYFVPVPQQGYQKAQSGQSQQALASWFGASSGEFGDVRAIRLKSSETPVRWYRFEVGRQPVERFIRRLQLEQLEMDDKVLDKEFMALLPPVDWWKPAELERESFFLGKDGQETIRLIYNAELETGYLLIN